jgi:hypothetical protein
MTIMQNSLRFWARGCGLLGLDVMGGWDRTTERWVNELAHQRAPGCYGDWRHAIRELAGLVMLRKAQDLIESVGIENPAFSGMKTGIGQRVATVQWRSHGPLIWVSRPLLDRFIDSEPMTLPEDIRRPFPAFTLMLPEHPDLTLAGRPVRSLSIAHVDSEHTDDLDPILEPVLHPDRPRHQLFLYARNDHENSLSAWACSDSDGGIQQPGHMDLPTRRSPEGMALDVGTVDVDPDSQDPTIRERSRTSDHIVSIAVNALMVLNFRGDLLGPEPPQRSKRKGQFPSFTAKTARPLRWLGETYRVPASADHGGSHASPRMHLRRAHWRSQPCGPGWTQRRWTWIDHVLVNSGQGVSCDP